MSSATLITKGVTDGLTLQPGATVSINQDETVEASAIYKTSSSNIDEGGNYDPPELGEEHPYEPDAKCYNITETRNQAGIITYDCAYFGISGGRKRSEKEIAYSGGTSSDPIETHPNFDTLGASSDYSYDAEGNFLGFTGGDLAGVQYYLTPSSTITISYWQDTAPITNSRVKIISGQELDSITKGFPLPSGVTNWLLIDRPYRQVGNFFQVSETFIASGPKGWSTEIYE